MDGSHIAALETSFEKLLAALGPTLTPEQATEVRDFLDVGEYGLALETAIGVLVEEGLRPSAPAVTMIGDLAARMGIADGPLVRDFRGRFAKVGLG
jgi:hypothetical protein